MNLLTKTVPCTMFKGLRDNESAVEMDNEQGMTHCLLKLHHALREREREKGGERERVSDWA